ncbi:uncharacterized protein LOC110643494 isoform X3 [Hevea brasiliensis]|uniref:uncharacterized protein LOC110643494 isoform X3 n=1 Tax=Hevea brasiliensis TaxID=3981 RepID=UPI0025F6510E|nr:uncharacterized protein LOC110643494 isoform X3 [Hevea brasiliensis]
MKYLTPLALFHELLKTKARERGRLLGLDVGDKYVGLAISDPHNKIASPLSVLLRKKTNIDLMASDFQSLISELSLMGFVVGYPFERGRARTAPDVCFHFTHHQYYHSYVSPSSHNVELLVKPLDLHPVLAKTITDKFAAVGILQGYLDYVNKKVELEAPE